MKKIIFFSIFSFVIFSNLLYHKSGSEVYYTSRLLKDADSETFKILGSGYAKDNKNVYLNGKKLKGVDLKTFEILSFGYSKDNNNIYNSNGKKLKGIDSNSFKIITCPNVSIIKRFSPYYTIDKNNTYYMGKVVTKYIPECGIGFRY